MDCSFCRIRYGCRANRVALDHFGHRIASEAGRVGGATMPSTGKLTAAEQLVQERVRAERELDHTAAGLANAERGAGGERQCRTPAVRRQLELMALGEGRDAAPLGRPAADRQVGLEDVGDAARSMRSTKSKRVNSLSPAAIGIAGRGPDAVAHRRGRRR